MGILVGQSFLMNMRKMSDELKNIPPSVSQIVERSLANYSNQQGVQKIYSLLEATENLMQFMIVSYGENWLIEKVDEYLKKSKLVKYKDYAQLEKTIKESRRKINEAQIIYDLSKGKKDFDKKNYEVTISRKITPYQKELHFLFNLMLVLSGMQNKVISRELLRSPEEARLSQTQFEKQEKK